MRRPITAAVLTTPGSPLEFRTVHLDDPGAGEVAVRAQAVGLCRSDTHYVDGALDIDLPAILGHEVVGVVERVGPDVSALSVGDRVVATVTPACGLCDRCLAGRPTQCSRSDQVRARSRPRVTDADDRPISLLGELGAFAEVFLSPVSALAKVPNTIPSASACLLGCCISTGAGAVLRGGRVDPTHTVAVVGCGGVGVAAIQAARLAGARQVVAVDTSAPKLSRAAEFGATDTVVASPEISATLEALAAVAPRGIDRSFEAVGHPATAELAFRMLAPTGVATVLGLMPAGQRVSIPADDLIYGDRVLQGAYMGANRFLSDTSHFVAHYEAGRLDLDAMVTATYPFAEINEAIEAMNDPAAVRIVATF